LIQTNYGYRLSGRHLWSSLFSTSVNASLSDYRYSFEEFPETSNEVRILGEQINEVSQRKVNVSNIYAHPRFTSTFGFEYTSWDTFILLGNRENGRDDDIFDIQAHEEAFFANVQPHISSNLFIDLGLRWSAYSKSFEGRKLIEPRVHAKYKMGDHSLPLFKLIMGFGCSLMKLLITSSTSSKAGSLVEVLSGLMEDGGLLWTLIEKTYLISDLSP